MAESGERESPPNRKRRIVLGISAFYHDSAAALLVDGRVVAAAQEERFSRRKHDDRFPALSIDFCLRHAGLAAESIDIVAYYEKPLLKFDRLLETYLAIAPRGIPSFIRAIPIWMKDKLFLQHRLREGLPGFRGTFVYPSHHESHAASAFYPSPFDDAAILTIDGVGEWATATIGVGEGRSIRLLKELRFPHSVGLLYSAFTYYCGFRVNSGEYKLMGLAPYGEPKYASLIRDRVVRVFEDGSIWMDPSYFNYMGGLTMTSPKLDRLLGGAPRRPESPITQREVDIAASIQLVAEEIILAMARHAHALTGRTTLCLAGGVALNCVANGRVLREGPYSDIWIQPASGDAGGSLGAALFAWHQLLEHERTPDRSPDGMQGALLGPEESSDDIERTLRENGAHFHRLSDESELLERAAELLDRGLVVGWVQGRMEFGPRALGARSILGDPRNSAMQTQMNVKIKFRESFRPFAPAVLEDRAAEWFDIDRRHRSPYMLLVAPVAKKRRTATAPAARRGLDRLKESRSTIQAVTHVDYSARVQTVRSGTRFHRLLEAFERRTQCPVLVNTSFNIRGEPIVSTAADAYRCFLNTDMDALIAGDCLVLKSENAAASEAARAIYIASFKQD